MDKDFKVTETKVRVTADNDLAAKEVQKAVHQQGGVLINLMGSPGAGKTSTLVNTINALKNEYRIGVMEADVDSDVDARTIQSIGAKVIQLHTGGSCHMDADMTERGLKEMGIEDLDVIFLENVGNLVCPAEFDVGADLKVMILSVPEGDDKPLKYPLMFQKSDALVITKTDALGYFDFDLEQCRKRALKLNPNIQIFAVSAKTGDGMKKWEDWLKKETSAWKAQ